MHTLHQAEDVTSYNEGTPSPSGTFTTKIIHSCFKGQILLWNETKIRQLGGAATCYYEEKIWNLYNIDWLDVNAAIIGATETYVRLRVLIQTMPQPPESLLSGCEEWHLPLQIMFREGGSLERCSTSCVLE